MMRRSSSRRPAQRAGERRVGREDPAAVGLVRHEAERTVADRRLVPGRPAEPVARHGVQQVSRENGEIGKDVGEARRRRGEAQDHGGVVRSVDSLERGELGRPGVADRRVTRRVEGPAHVARGRRDAVVPGHAGLQMKRQRPPVRRPLPGPCQVGLGHERRVVAREGRQQHVALHLPRERMQGEQRIHALEIGAGGEQHGGPAARRCRLAAGERDEHDERHAETMRHGERYRPPFIRGQSRWRRTPHRRRLHPCSRWLAARSAASASCSGS